MQLRNALRYAMRVIGFGVGALPAPPPIRHDPAISAARETERRLRENSVRLVRDLRTDNLARLQRRLSGDA